VRLILRLVVAAALLAAMNASRAGAQKYEPLAASVRAALHAAVAYRASPEPIFPDPGEKISWLADSIRSWCWA